MKKLIILLLSLLAITGQSFAQCEQPTQLPYIEDNDAAMVPALPQCMQTSWSSFASSEVFKSVAGPIGGFEGQVLAYSTAANTQTPFQVSAKLETPLMVLEQGMAYTVYFLYGNSDPDLTISSLSIYLSGTNMEIGSIANITGAQPSNFISAQFTPPSSGTYSIIIDVDSAGNQGLIYLDDIMVQEVGVMGVEKNKIDELALYPNPVKNVLTLDYSDTIDGVEVYSSTGQLLLSEKPDNAIAHLNLERLAAGVYFVNVYSGGLTKRSKILKDN